MNTRLTWVFCAIAVAAFARPVTAQETFVVDTTLAAAGKKVFAAKACQGCHTIGRGDLVAPDLGGLLERRTAEWVKNWLRDPGAMIENDETAKALFKQYGNMRMPNLRLSREEILALMHYIENESRTMKASGPAAQ